MRIETWKTSTALAPYVSSYGVREASLGDRRIHVPLPARLDCFLEFYMEDRYKIVTVATGTVHRAPRLVLVGPQTRRREDLLLSGHLKNFTVRFTPTGFRALFGIPASAIRDVADCAELVLGTSVVELQESLAAAEESAWPAISERFFLGRLPRLKAGPGAEVAAQMAHSLRRVGGAATVAAIAYRHRLSVRHAERCFAEYIGTTPKMYSRLLRLQTALESTRGEVRPEWAGVALNAGYFDQSHMVREFRELTGETPVRFAALQAAGNASPPA
jgi:AraC-like DNA-binding protein